MCQEVGVKMKFKNWLLCQRHNITVQCIPTNLCVAGSKFNAGGLTAYNLQMSTMIPTRCVLWSFHMYTSLMVV